MTSVNTLPDTTTSYFSLDFQCAKTVCSEDENSVFGGCSLAFVALGTHEQIFCGVQKQSVYIMCFCSVDTILEMVVKRGD